MRILFVTEVGRHYAQMVEQLRRTNQVDHLFIGARWRVEHGNYHIPKLFGRHIGYKFLTSLLVHYLLFRNKYDFCITDYRSAFRPSIFCIISNLAKRRKTQFIHDVRTIPVDYANYLSKAVERKFSKQLRFANRFYQGISLITEQMKKHIEQKYVRINKPLCIWESGVDTKLFKPAPKSIRLNQKFGFEHTDFVCFYHGSFSEKRGIIELVESFAIIKQKEKNIKLLILGGVNGYNRVSRLIENLHLDDTVRLHDWVPYDEVPQYISIADLCIIPLPDIDWWRVSSPLKLMEYIACGKNILLTDIVAHTSVVGTNSSYFWIKDVTADTLAKKVFEAYESFTLDRAHFYERGMKERQTLVNNISWETRSKRLEEFLATFNQRD